MTLGEAARRAPHLKSLTSLRFFAAAFVVVHHAFGPDNIPVVDLGFLGVTFFFALSGFILTWSGSSDNGVWACYRNRFARVYPLHVVTLLIAVMLPFAMSDGPATFVQNLFLLQAWTPDGAHSFNWVSWSISAEAFFYLLFPFVISVLRNRSPRTLLVTGGLAWLVPVVLTAVLNRTVPDVAFFLTYDFPPFRFGEFLAGVCLALWMKQGGRPTQLMVRGSLAAAGIFAAVIIAADVLHPLGRSYDSALLLPCVLVVLFAAATSDSAGRPSILHSRYLVTLGQWSFALYLVHMLVIRCFSYLIGQDRASYLPWWAALLAAVLSVAASGVAYSLVEKPLEKRLRSDRRLPAVLAEVGRR